MTEHVHEWIWTGSMWEPYECKQCGAGVTLTKDQADARINATERLSAEDARCSAEAVLGDTHGDRWIAPLADDLLAYANLLEEKCPRCQSAHCVCDARSDDCVWPREGK